MDGPGLSKPSGAKTFLAPPCSQSKQKDGVGCESRSTNVILFIVIGYSLKFIVNILKE